MSVSMLLQQRSAMHVRGAIVTVTVLHLQKKPGQPGFQPKHNVRKGKSRSR